LLEYAQDAERYSTLVAIYDGGVVAFITLHEHFPSTWEVHCIAVEAQYRNQGVGRMLQAAAESWLIEKGVRLLQVKTLAPSFASAEYAETREFYRTAGYIPVEVFPELWEVGLPVLQLVKVLESAA
jgi:GNAT superfamily N-acetyltransferase